MKSITIHNLDQQLAERIKWLADQKGMSQNQLIKILLTRALGITDKEKNANLMKFSSTWSDEEVEHFFENNRIFDEIDEGEW